MPSGNTQWSRSGFYSTRIKRDAKGLTVTPGKPMAVVTFTNGATRRVLLAGENLTVWDRNKEQMDVRPHQIDAQILAREFNAYE